MAEKTKKKKEPISSFSILLILLVVLAVISWIAAAATGGTVTAASLSNILTSPIYGFTGAPTDIVEGAANPDTFPGGALEVCFFVMILGGFLGVMTKTGALDNGIAVLVKKLKGNELVLIPILMILFSIGGTTYGMCEETVPFYVLLGFFCGACSLYFLRTTLKLEDRLGKMKNPYTKWAFCAAGLGLLIFLFPPLYGEGYDALSPLLNGQEISYDGESMLAFMLHKPWMVPVFFALILILKVFSMTFTNAGGGVGGTFGPTLFVGAIAGFLLARVTNLLLAGSEFTVPEQNFVLVGMAGLMAGVMQAPMTAIFLIAEISGGYELFIPLIITATISFGTIRFFEKYSIYTKRIAMTGDLLTHDSDQAVLTLLKVSDVVETNFSPVSIDATLGEFVQVISSSARNIFPVVDSRNHLQGYVSLEDVRKDMFRQDLYDKMHVYNYMKSSPAYVYDGEKMDSVMSKFESTDAWNLPVVKKDRTYIGFVSKSKIFSAYRDELKELSQD